MDAAAGGNDGHEVALGSRLGCWPQDADTGEKALILSVRGPYKKGPPNLGEYRRPQAIRLLLDYGASIDQVSQPSGLDDVDDRSARWLSPVR